MMVGQLSQACPELGSGGCIHTGLGQAVLSTYSVTGTGSREGTSPSEPQPFPRQKAVLRSCCAPSTGPTQLQST